MEFDLDRSIEVLSATPAVIGSMLGGLSEDWTASGTRKDWGPFDVVGHLINCEYTDWIPRARVIVDQGNNGIFPPFDRYAHFEQSEGKTLAQLLDEFEAARASSLEVLRSWNLTGLDLLREGIHPDFGRVTLGQLLATWTVHDMTHIRQIATSIAKRYNAAVGPWKAYLSILK